MTRKTVVLVLGLTFSAAFLIAALQDVQWEQVLRTFGSVKTTWIAVAGALLMSSVLTRSLRWNIITGKSTTRFFSFWRAANLGYLGNMILPARAGEVMRMAAIHRLENIRPGLAVGSVVADRVADGLALSLFLGLVSVYHGRHVLEFKGLAGPALIFFLLALALALFVRWGDKAPLALWNVTRCYSWAGRVRGWYAQAFEGLQILRCPQRMGIVAALSVLAFFLDSLMLLALMRSFGWGLTYMAAATVAVFLAAGSMLPAAPGYLGIYQLACVLAFRLFHMDASFAVAYSVILHALLLLTFLIFGGMAAVLFRGCKPMMNPNQNAMDAQCRKIDL